MSDINEADLTALLAELRDHAANGYKTCQYAALTALVAERYRLGKCVAELEARAKTVYITDGERVESIDLRERLVCAALTGILAHEGLGSEREFDCVIDDAIWMSGKALAAMRKGDGDGK